MTVVDLKYYLGVRYFAQEILGGVHRLFMEFRFAPQVYVKTPKKRMRGYGSPYEPPNLLDPLMEFFYEFLLVITFAPRFLRKKLDGSINFFDTIVVK